MEDSISRATQAETGWKREKSETHLSLGNPRRSPGEGGTSVLGGLGNSLFEPRTRRAGGENRDVGERATGEGGRLTLVLF